MEWLWISGLMVAMYLMGSFIARYIIRMDKPDDTEQRMWGKVHEAQTAFYESGHGDGWEEALHAAREAVLRVKTYNADQLETRDMALDAIDALDDES